LGDESKYLKLCTDSSIDRTASAAVQALTSKAAPSIDCPAADGSKFAFGQMEVFAAVATADAGEVPVRAMRSKN
jgi:hypothetical protein